MKFIADIDIMPKPEILDPQGKAVSGSMKNLGLNDIHDVRIGKHVRLEVEAASEEKAHELTETACKKLLANQIMENYSIKISLG